METTKIDFSNRLSELLIEKNITQKELAKACNLSTQCVSALITGRNNPTGTTVATFAKYFECSADYLLGLENDFGVSTVAPMGESERYSEEERKLVEDYRVLNNSGKKLVKQTVETLRATTAQSGQKKDIS